MFYLKHFFPFHYNLVPAHRNSLQTPVEFSPLSLSVPGGQLPIFRLSEHRHLPLLSLPQIPHPNSSPPSLPTHLLMTSCFHAPHVALTYSSPPLHHSFTPPLLMDLTSNNLKQFETI